MKKLFLIIIVICSIGWYIPETSASDIIWHTHHYVDEFGEPIQRRFATTYPVISGTFSNSATQDSKLNIRFLIDEEGIAIQLYEYAGNNPVKAYGRSRYNVLFKDKNGHCEQYTLPLREDRIICPKTIDGCNLHDALLKGGTIKFVIREEKYPINIYKFTIKSVQPEKIGSYAKAYKDLG